MAAKKNAAGLERTDGAENFANTSTTNSSGARGPAQRDRRPPAFQLYASDTLADRRFILMSAAERGLLMSMRMACWVGDSVPSDPALLARVVGLPVDEVVTGLSPAVLSFFRPESDGALQDPELAAQMTRLVERRRVFRENGACGGRPREAAVDGGRDSKPQAKPNGKPGGYSGGYPPARAEANPTETPLSRAEQSRKEGSSKASPEEALHKDVSRVPTGARARGNGTAGVAS